MTLFCFFQDPLRYTQVNRLYLVGKARITKKDGTGLGPKPTTGIPEFNLVDGWSNAFIKSITLTVNHKVISESTGSSYYYRCLLSRILNFGEEGNQTQMRSLGHTEPVRWVDKKWGDTAGLIDEKNYHKANMLPYLKEESLRFYDNQYVEFNTLLMVPEFMTDREWPPNLEIEISIARQPDEFFFIQDDGDLKFQMHLEDLALEVHKIQPSPSLLASNHKLMASAPALFPYTGYQVAEFKIPKDTKYIATPELFLGRVPAKTIYLLIPLAQYQGSAQKNPSILSPCGIKTFRQRLNGMISPLEFEFQWDKQKNYTISYRRILDAVAPLLTGQGCALTYEEFAKCRFAILANNVPQSLQSNDNFREKPQLGNVYCELFFEKDTKEDLLLLCLGLTDESYRINLDGDVIHDPPVY